MPAYPIPEHYQYEAYPEKRIGVFRVEKKPSEYRLPEGWVMVEEQRTIIGESNDCYVTRLLKSELGFWQGDEIVTEYSTLPLGLHKSRFVKWLPVQLSLF
jgi:hypothetical protein